jgi:mRNA interferase RelE/StbE
MAYAVEVLKSADRDLSALGSQPRRRILRFLYDRVAKLPNPRSIGQALQGPQFGEFWKYRVGDFRIICKIEDQRLIVVVVRVGHRREIYR